MTWLQEYVDKREAASWKKEESKIHVPFHWELVPDHSLDRRLVNRIDIREHELYFPIVIVPTPWRIRAMVESYEGKVKAALTAWSMPGGEHPMFRTEIKLKQVHIDSISEVLMPVIEDLIARASTPTGRGAASRAPSV